MVVALTLTLRVLEEDLEPVFMMSFTPGSASVVGLEAEQDACADLINGVYKTKTME